MGYPQGSYQTDSNVEVKTVRFLPTTTSDVVRTGYVVCYKLTNGTDGTAPHNRFTEVERPSSSNINLVAGVVTADSSGATSGENIRIVPFASTAITLIHTDQNCTKGTTQLFAAPNSYAATATATGNTKIATCTDTADRSTTAGTVQARLHASAGDDTVA